MKRFANENKFEIGLKTYRLFFVRVLIEAFPEIPRVNLVDKEINR